MSIGTEQEIAGIIAVAIGRWRRHPGGLPTEDGGKAEPPHDNHKVEAKSNRGASDDQHPQTEEVQP
jgi:hypothetical protein